MKKIKITKKNPVIKEEKSAPFQLELQVGGKKIRHRGSTMIEALNRFTIPNKTNFVDAKGKLTTKCIFNISQGKKKTVRLMKPFEIKKLLVSDFNKIVFVKRMLSVMK